jgi:hypothetical protein
MQRLQFLSAVTVSGSGQTPAFNISDVKQGAITLNITAVAGTTPVMTVWLQESDDGGTTWYDTYADVVQKNSTTGVEDAAATNKRNICSSATVAAQYRAAYSNLNSDYYRLKYELTGTGPQFTVNVSMNAK